MDTHEEQGEPTENQSNPPSPSKTLGLSDATSALGKKGWGPNLVGRKRWASGIENMFWGWKKG